jgi:hypothetical protein
MKVILGIFIVFIIFVIYDYNNFDNTKKLEEIKKVSKEISFHKINFDFKSKEYREFVYDK